MKILISAYSFETGRGSEGENGWHTVNELAKNMKCAWSPGPTFAQYTYQALLKRQSLRD